MKRELKRFWSKYIDHFAFWQTLALVVLYCLHILSLFFSISWLLSDACNMLNNGGERFYLPLIPLAVALATGAVRLLLKSRTNLSCDIRTSVVESVLALVMIALLSATDLGFLSAFLGALTAIVLFVVLAFFEDSNWENKGLERIRVGKKYVCVLSGVAYVLIATILNNGIHYEDLTLMELVWNQIALWGMFKLVQVYLLGVRTQSQRRVWPGVPRRKKLYTLRFGRLCVSPDSKTVRLLNRDGRLVNLLELYGRGEYEGEEYVFLLPTFYDEEMADGLIVLRCLSEESDEYESVDDPGVYRVLYDRFKCQYGLSFDFVERDELMQQAKLRVEANGEEKNETGAESGAKEKDKAEAEQETETETEPTPKPESDSESECDAESECETETEGEADPGSSESE